MYKMYTCLTEVSKKQTRIPILKMRDSVMLFLREHSSVSLLARHCARFEIVNKKVLNLYRIALCPSLQRKYSSVTDERNYMY